MVATAAAAAARSIAGRPRTPRSSAAPRSDSSRCLADASSIGASASAVSSSTSTSVPPRPTSTTGPKRASWRAPTISSTPPRTSAVRSTYSSSGESVGLHLERSGVQRGRVRQADTNASPVGLVGQRGVDGLEGDGVQAKTVRRGDGSARVVRDRAVGIRQPRVGEQRARLDVADRPDERRGGLGQRQRRRRDAGLGHETPGRPAHGRPARCARTRPGRHARSEVPPPSGAYMLWASTGSAVHHLQRREPTRLGGLAAHVLVGVERVAPEVARQRDGIDLAGLEHDARGRREGVELRIADADQVDRVGDAAVGRQRRVELRDHRRGQLGHVQAVGMQQVGADGAVPAAVADHRDAAPARQRRADERLQGVDERARRVDEQRTRRLAGRAQHGLVRDERARVRRGAATTGLAGAGREHDDGLPAAGRARGRHEGPAVGDVLDVDGDRPASPRARRDARAGRAASRRPGCRPRRSG